MQDLLEFPNITATDALGQLAQVRSYMIRFKEQLEFVLQNIGIENLSADLRGQLQSLGADVESAKTTASDGRQRIESVASKSVLTVSDVINSAMYKASAESIKEEIYENVAVSVDNGVELCDGTMICCGTYEGEVIFPAAFEAVPVVITSPNVAVTVTADGFSAEETGFTWIAIGRYVKEAAE